MDEFRKLVLIMERLRGEGGCEWDRAQSHFSLRQYLLEETYEVVEAVSRKDPSSLCEELGDLLLQILFHAQISSEAGEFDITDVIRSISEKMIRRHPHVFSNPTAKTPEAVSLQWDHIKATLEHRNSSSILDGVPCTFPALLRGAKITKKASRAGFDWENIDQVLKKVDEETAELKTAIAGGDPGEIEHEFGDILFALVNLGRFLRVNPEVALVEANRRFERRFRAMEQIALKSGVSVLNATMETLDTLWEEAKRITS